ncbi:MAG TPA: hypothetical protein VJV78_13175 [Polyangiales bacterium]|nr:hypothetical protein [Polyangiales bacterium]
MYRGALHISALLLVLAPGTRAFAHGVPPEAYAVLSQDAQGPRAVALSAGVGLRRGPQSYQFVCPMAWGDQFASPLAPLADGTIVVGATAGLMLLGDDGSLRPHPDPAAIGRTSDVVRSKAGVFALRPTAMGTELLAVDAQSMRVLWKDAKSLYSLAALDDRLVVVRAMGTMLEQVTIGLDGTELERQMATLDAGVDYVFARANAGAAYVLLVYRSGTVALGSLRMNTFTKLAEGELSIAGPLSVGNVTLLALDGQLTQLVEGHTSPLADDHRVICLAERDGLTYACDGNGIARLNGQALTDPLFRFSWLTAPDLARVPEGDERFVCNQQWQDLRFDIGLLMPEAAGAPADPALAAGAGAPIAGAMQPMAGVGGVAAAGGGPVVAPGAPVQQDGGGCATLPGRNAPLGGPLGLALALVVVRCRPRRRLYRSLGSLNSE